MGLEIEEKKDDKLCINSEDQQITVSILTWRCDELNRREQVRRNNGSNNT